MLIGLSVAGVVIGNSRAESELAAGIGRVINPEAAEYVFSLVARFSAELKGSHLPLIGILGALVAATAVFVELQSSLNVIWRVGPRASGSWASFGQGRYRCFVVGIGFALVSVVTGMLATINGIFMKTLRSTRDPALAQNGAIWNGAFYWRRLTSWCRIRIEWKDVLVRP
jgi:membrane protein